MNKAPYLRPTSIEDANLRKNEIINIMLLFQQKLIYLDDVDDEEINLRRKKLKSGIIKMQRELAWIKGVIKGMNKDAVKDAVKESKSEIRRNKIGKAFSLICNDAANCTIPVFRDAQQVVEYYLTLAEDEQVTHVFAGAAG